MIIKLNEKPTTEDFKKVLDRKVIDHRFSYIYFPEIKEAIMVDHSEYFPEFKDEVRLVHAYKIIGRAIVFGDWEFLAVGGGLCKLFRNDEDFCLVLSDAMRETNFKDSVELFKELIKLL